MSPTPSPGLVKLKSPKMSSTEDLKAPTSMIIEVANSSKPRKKKKAGQPAKPKEPPKKLYQAIGDDLFTQLPFSFQRPPFTHVQDTCATRNTSSESSARSSFEKSSENLSLKKSKKSKKNDNATPLDEFKYIKSKYKQAGAIFTLEDFSAIIALERLAKRYGKVSHMGILDRSYTFFITKDHTAALYFKVKDKVAVVGGDPLCESEKYDHLLKEFAKYRKKFSWDLAFLGASSSFIEYCKQQNWTALQFGLERVLNPMTNEVLLESSGKRMLTQHKQLLRTGNTLHIYRPIDCPQPILEEELVNIYETWRAQRNQTTVQQSYITIYDPFSLPNLMTYIYLRDSAGKACGMAALRQIKAGMHIDPCIAMPDASRGVSDLLMFASMALLHKCNIKTMSLGYEPLDELGDIIGMPQMLHSFTRKMHHHIFNGLSVQGKKAFYDKYKPDIAQEEKMYIVFPRHPGIRDMKAIMHISNISIRGAIAQDWKRRRAVSKERKELYRAEIASKSTPNLPEAVVIPRLMPKAEFITSDTSSAELSRKSESSGERR